MPMIVQVRGVGFGNQGAALMLLAALQRLARHGDQVQVAAEPFGAYEKRARLGLRQILPSGGLGRSSLASRLLPASFREAYGVVRPEHVDVVLDASGYAYADAWGAGPAMSLLHKARYWSARGRKVILLPQAFGPFELPDLRSAFAELRGVVDLAFARDDTSLGHAAEVWGETAPLRRAPDFTLTVQPDDELMARHVFDGVTLVPNVRVLDKTSEQVAGRYVGSLSSCIRWLRAADRDARILVHGAGDLTAARRILGADLQDVPILQEDDALAWKAALRGSRLVVGSRYHALVSSLSSGVPTIGMGWSHKYEELFREYGVEAYCVPADAPEASLLEAIRSALDPATSRTLREALASHRVAVEKEVESMWGRVERSMGLPPLAD